MKAVFDTKPSSGYDDDLTRHYQFPRRYLGQVKEAVGDWVVLRRPRADGGNLAYFAVAQVAGLDPDPTAPTLTFARLTNYLEFGSTVAWRREGQYAEQALREMPIKQVGVYLRGRSVRPLSDADFAAIVSAGLSQTLAPDNAIPFCTTSGPPSPTPQMWAAWTSDRPPPLMIRRPVTAQRSS